MDYLSTLALLIVASSTAQPQTAPYSQPAADAPGPVPQDLPSYRYSGQKLLLRVICQRPQSAKVRWRKVLRGGQVAAKAQQKVVQLVAGENTINLPVGRMEAHLVQLGLATGSYRMWPNRGQWYVDPHRSSPDKDSASAEISRAEFRRGYNSALGLGSDAVISGGFRVQLKGQQSLQQVTVGRTFGTKAGGIPASRRHAVVLVARGDPKAIRITLAQSRGKTHYWDYWINLEQDYRRYVIPLKAFVPRSQQNQQLRLLHSLALTTHAAVKPGQQLAVDMLALTEVAPVIAKIKRRHRGVEVRLRGPVLPKNARLYFDRGDGEPLMVEPRSDNTVRLNDPAQTRVWFCYGQGVTSCDPADAPHTAYPLPPIEPRSVLVDDFGSAAPVNNMRLVNWSFFSDQTARRGQRPTLLRQRGHLGLIFFPQTSQSYAGYVLPLSQQLDPRLQTVKIAFRADAPVSVFKVGVKFQGNREPKVSVVDYLQQPNASWHTVHIPLQAFRAAVFGWGVKKPTGPPRAITLTTESPPAGQPYTLNVDSVELIPQLSKVCLARFDQAPEPGAPTQLIPIQAKASAQTMPAEPAAVDGQALPSSLAGVIRRETSGAATLSSRLVPGKVGQALEVTCSDIGGKDYALLALNLGRIDGRPYRVLSFYVKGLGGGEDATLYLRDGSGGSPVQLSDYLQVSQSWQFVEVPLSDFGVRQNDLRQLVLAWENRPITREQLLFDEFFLE